MKENRPTVHLLVIGKQEDRQMPLLSWESYRTGRQCGLGVEAAEVPG